MNHSIKMHLIQALFSNMTLLHIYIMWKVAKYSKSKQFQLKNLESLHTMIKVSLCCSLPKIEYKLTLLKINRQILINSRSYLDPDQNKSTVKTY